MRLLPAQEWPLLSLCPQLSPRSWPMLLYSLRRRHWFVQLKLRSVDIEVQQRGFSMRNHQLPELISPIRAQH